MAVTKYATLGTAMNWSASTWGESVASGVWVKTTATLTPASSPGWTINALAGLKVQINTELYTVSTNTASAAVMTASGGTNDGTYAWILHNEAPPGDTDTADLNGAVVAMDIATIPASGTLDLLRSGATNNSAGQLTVDMATQAKTINCTTMQAATKNTGLIYASSAAHGLTINGGTVAGQGIIGGTGSLAYGLNLVSGSMSGIVINANVQGGTAGGTVAVAVQGSTTTTTLNGNMINSSSCVAWYGKPPTWVQSGGVAGAQYCQLGTQKYGPEPTAVQLLKGIVCGDVTGTLKGTGKVQGSTL